jgi:hypothetical protein
MADAYERGLIPQRVAVEFATQDTELTERTEKIHNEVTK